MFVHQLVYISISQFSEYYYDTKQKLSDQLDILTPLYTLYPLPPQMDWRADWWLSSSIAGVWG